MPKPSAKPVRLQLKRRKSFKLQRESKARNGLPAVNCARPGWAGNPYVVDSSMTAEQACAFHRRDLMQTGAVTYRRKVTVEEIKHRLRGRNLACFCPEGSPHCHVDTLLEVANGD